MQLIKSRLMNILRKIGNKRLAILFMKEKETNLNLVQTELSLNHQKIRADEVELGAKNILYKISTLLRLGTNYEIKVK